MGKEQCWGVGSVIHQMLSLQYKHGCQHNREGGCGGWPLTLREDTDGGAQSYRIRQGVVGWWGGEGEGSSSTAISVVYREQIHYA